MRQVEPVFCAVIETRTNWVNSASLLIHSLRQRGGAYSACHFNLFLVSQEPTSGQFSQIHEDSLDDVSIMSLAREQPIPHLSKVNSLFYTPSDCFSHYILLDHDTIILHLDGLSNYLTEAIYARRNYKYGLSRTLGRDYKGHLNRFHARPWSQIHYFNSGVVITPKAYAKQLGVKWKEWANRLSLPYQGHPLSEQLGFAMALAETDIPYNFLPVTFNQTNWRAPSPEAAIAHYNSFDPINKTVKEEALRTYDDFRDFLHQTENRFWRQYRSQILSLMTPDLDALAHRIASAVAPTQKGRT